MIRTSTTEHYYTEHLCRKHPNMIFIFGDNLIGRGKAGQAIIRDEPNSFGIPTKRLPAMTQDSFFSDQQDEINTVMSKIKELYLLQKQGKIIILPKNKIGSGLAKTKEKSPKIWAIIESMYSHSAPIIF